MPPVQPQMMLAFGSCKTQIVPPDHLIRMSEEKLHEIVRNLEYKPLANVIDFSTISRFVFFLNIRFLNYTTRKILVLKLVSHFLVRGITFADMSLLWIGGTFST